MTRYYANPIQTEDFNARMRHRAYELMRAAERRSEGRQASTTISRESRRAQAMDSGERRSDLEFYTRCAERCMC